jgi:hypothetical protein
VTQRREIETACALRRQRFMINDPRMKICSVAIGTCSINDDGNAVLHSFHSSGSIVQIRGSISSSAE